MMEPEDKLKHSPQHLVPVLVSSKFNITALMCNPESLHSLHFLVTTFLPESCLESPAL